MHEFARVLVNYGFIPSCRNHQRKSEKKRLENRVLAPKSAGSRVRLAPEAEAAKGLTEPSKPPGLWLSFLASKATGPNGRRTARLPQQGPSTRMKGQGIAPSAPGQGYLTYNDHQRCPAR